MCEAPGEGRHCGTFAPADRMEPASQQSSRRYLLTLSLGALGVVYGDIGTSPLYALRECFRSDRGVLPTPQNVIGVLSLIAGLVQSPSNYDPTRRDVPRTDDGIPVQTKERQRYVLEQMARSGMISVTGYQRSARSQSRCLPRRPATAISPRVCNSSSISPTCRMPHQAGCARAAIELSSSSRESSGPRRSSSRRT